jgi:Cupin-like domain
MKPSAKRQRRELATVPIIDANICPENFFNSYVLQRAPVKFNTLITDKSWKGDKWTNKILRERSGDATLRVEKRGGPNESFGLGNEDKMTFNSFLDSLENDCETSYYLTTQELSYTHEGQPSLTSPPVDGLIGDFPWVPKICGNLVPQNINLWFGSSKLPTSSGLHHDFHDNLYLLLRGEKKITLFSPDEAHNMYTVGEIVNIHPNGRINYKDQLTNAGNQIYVHLQSSLLYLSSHRVQTFIKILCYPIRWI